MHDPGTRLGIAREALADFCRRHHVRKVSFFGSILRDGLGPESDVDILVEFSTGKTPGFAFFEMQDELSRPFGRCVDLNTPADLSRRERVLATAEVGYVAA